MTRAQFQPALRASITAIVVNIVLGAVKLVAGLVGNSYALVADAVESLADCASSAIVWGGLSIASRPPDENHPYGHGKAEPLAALAVGAILVAAAVGIAVAAVHEIVTPHHAPAPYTLAVLIVVVITKEIMYRAMSRVGRSVGSAAVGADAWHQRADALTSLIAGLGIGAALLGGPGYEAADDWAALAAALVIARNGAVFSWRAMTELMDVQPPDEFLCAVAETARSVSGVLAVEKVLARKAGVSYLVDMHIEVEASMPVRDAHALAHRVKDAILASDRRVADVLIHVEPHR